MKAGGGGNRKEKYLVSSQFYQNSFFLQGSMYRGLLKSLFARKKLEVRSDKDHTVLMGFGSGKGVLLVRSTMLVLGLFLKLGSAVC